MCGHVGIVGGLEYKDEALLKRLLIFDYFRGPDSTGVAVISKDGTASKIAKIASHPVDLFDTTKFKAISAFQSSVFIGHNRAATRGIVNTVNAHPYEFGHIIGAHNGTLSIPSFNDLKKKLGEDFDVDSQAIFACIEKFGIEETVPLLQGAWALVWYDLNEGTLNFLRNKERPFWVGYSDDYKKVYWSSEWQILRSAIDIAPNDHKLWRDDGNHCYFATEVDLHYKIDVQALKANNGSVYEPATQVLKGKEPAPIATTTPFTAGRPPVGSGSSATSGTTTNYRGTDSNTVVNLFCDDGKPFGDVITEEQFWGITTHGCSWCSEPVNFNDEDLFIDLPRQHVLCSDCNSANFTRVHVSNLATVN